jgi:hypothetical protein
MSKTPISKALKDSVDAFESGALPTKLDTGVRLAIERKFRAKYRGMPEAEWRLLRRKVLDTARRSGKIAAHMAAFENRETVRTAVAIRALRLAKEFCPAPRAGRMVIMGKICHGVALG